MSSESGREEEEEQTLVSLDKFFFPQGVERRSMSSESGREEEEEQTLVSLDAVLSDDLLEKTLALLPIWSIHNASLVSKRWHAVVHRPWAVVPPPQTAVFFMFVDHAHRPLEGHTYDPSLRRWSTARLDSLEKDYWDVAASSGLVCMLTGRDARGRLFVCNPVTGNRKQLPSNPLLNIVNPNSIAMSVDRETHNYTIAIVSCCELAIQNWDVSVHVYESTSQTWAVALSKSMPWFEHRSIICNGVLYCLFSGNLFNEEFCLLSYDLAARPRSKSFRSITVPAPTSLLRPLFFLLSPVLSNPWIINLREKLIMVAMVQNNDSPHEMVALGIWELGKEGWHEVAHITREQIEQKFGDKCYMIYSCGAGEFIYVHCCNSRYLLIFDVVQKQWQWSTHCPIEIRNEWDPSTIGFCFEPNLKINC